MILGILNEQYDDDSKVSLIPEHAKLIIEQGHKVYICSGAGKGANISDSLYKSVGCIILNNNSNVIEKSNVISSYKIPKLSELEEINSKKILVTFESITNKPNSLATLKEKEATLFNTENIKEINETNSFITSKIFFHELNNCLNKILKKGIYKTPNIEKENFLIFGYNEFSKNLAREIQKSGHNATIISEQNISSIEGIEILINTKENIQKYLNKCGILILTGQNPFSYQKEIIKLDFLKDIKDKKIIIDTTMNRGGGIDYTLTKKIGNNYYKYNQHVIYSPKNITTKFSKNISTSYSSAIFETLLNILNKNSNSNYKKMLLINKGLEQNNIKVKNIAKKQEKNKNWENIELDDINIALSIAQIEEKSVDIIED